MACLSTILRSAFAAAIAAVLAASDTRFASAQEQIDLSSIAASDKSTTFDEPTAAVEAFKAALAANDLAAVAKLVGLDAEKLKAGEDTASIFAQIREAAAKQVTVDELGDRRVLHLGEKLWPFPFPLVKDENGKWAFDTSAGLEEIVNRRIGENELEAIRTMRELCRSPARVRLRGLGRRRRPGVRAKADQQSRRDGRPVLAARPGRRR